MYAEHPLNKGFFRDIFGLFATFSFEWSVTFFQSTTIHKFSLVTNLNI